MSKNDMGNGLYVSGLPDGDDEIEILEVVGIDEDAPPGSEADELVEVDSDEIVLSFDEESDGVAAAVPGMDGSPDSGEDERLARLRAEFDNYRKRVERDRENYQRDAVSGFALRMLPVLDNFERALSTPSAHEEDGFRDGVRLIYRQLMDELRREGLEAIDAVGTPFDPARHEAVSTDTTGEHPANIVLDEFERGYMLQGRLLRPSKVRVTVDPAIAAREGVKSEGS